MGDSIREQIEFLKISGSVLPRGSAEQIADTMEKLLAVVEGLQKFVDLQAEDEGLWFIAETASEAYVQRGLRGCHQYIEEQLAALDKQEHDD